MRGGKKEIDSIIDTKLFNDVYQRSMGSLKKKKKIQFSVKGRNIDEGTLSSCRLVAWKSRFSVNLVGENSIENVVVVSQVRYV